MYTVVTAPVYEMLQAQGYQATFTAAISGEKVEFFGTVFVDDADAIRTAKKPKTPPSTLANDAKEGLEAIGRIMRPNGQAFNMSKVKCYIIAFEFVDGEPQLIPADPELQFQLTDIEGKECTIEMLEPTAAEEALGVWMSPDGNCDTAAKELMKKSQRWAEQSRRGTLSAHEAWTDFTTTISKTLEYPLVALTLSERQCNQIQGPAITATFRTPST